MVFLLEHFDNRIKSPDELTAITGMPILGSVMRYQADNGMGPISSPTESRYGALSESYKFLQTNLEFAAMDTSGVKTLLVTSSSPEEGKTTTAANLAISVAREGKSVILVDTDLRKPALHRIFDLRDRKGLTNLLMNNATQEEVLAQSGTENLEIIPSGPIPPEATQVLRSPKMKEVIEQLESRADLVILDSPPLLSVTDPMLLTPLVDGVLLVVDAHRTGRDTLKRGAETLHQAHPAVVGTVLNKITPRGGSYYYYYYYRSYYSYSEEGAVRHRRGVAGLVSKILGRRRQQGSRRGHRGNTTGILPWVRGNLDKLRLPHRYSP